MLLFEGKFPRHNAQSLSIMQEEVDGIICPFKVYKISIGSRIHDTYPSFSFDVFEHNDESAPLYAGKHIVNNKKCNFYEDECLDEIVNFSCLAIFRSDIVVSFGGFYSEEKNIINKINREELFKEEKQISFPEVKEFIRNALYPFWQLFCSKERKKYKSKKISRKNPLPSLDQYVKYINYNKNYLIQKIEENNYLHCDIVTEQNNYLQRYMTTEGWREKYNYNKNIYPNPKWRNINE